MSAFYEFTGAKSPKVRRRFTLAGSPIMGVAGLWRETEVTSRGRSRLLTCEPGPDVVSFHNRQIVVLKPTDWRSWLKLKKREDELRSPLRGDALSVETIRGVRHNVPVGVRPEA